jgi:hypothetical protein
VYEKMPFAFPQTNHRFRWDQLNYDVSFFILMKKLAKASQLRSLALVLPEHCTYSSSPFGGVCKILTGLRKLSAAKPLVEFHIIRMVGTNCWHPDLDRSQTRIIKIPRGMNTCRVRFAAFFLSGNWHLAERQPYVNYAGNVVAYEEAFEDIVDILPDIKRVFNGT